MSADVPSRHARWFERAALAALVYTIGVIVFGAWVRITGSGAGCGRNWPTCHGEVVPRAPGAETVIEFTHRLTSGLSLIAVLVVLALAIRWFPRGHAARAGAVASVVLMIVEALIGAGLVIFGLVEDNDSVARALYMSLHLVNTLLLTGAMTLTVWWARHPPRGPGRSVSLIGLLMAGAGGLVLTSMMGAVTALGDTLYPVTESGPLVDMVAMRLQEGYQVNHFLIRMRILHPAIAIVVAIWVVVVAAGVSVRGANAAARRWGAITAAIVSVQVLIGFANVALGAPGWMQLVHLGVAMVLWVSLVLAAAAESSGDAPDRVAQAHSGASTGPTGVHGEAEA